MGFISPEFHHSFYVFKLLYNYPALRAPRTIPPTVRETESKEGELFQNAGFPNHLSLLITNS